MGVTRAIPLRAPGGEGYPTGQRRRGCPPREEGCPRSRPVFPFSGKRTRGSTRNFPHGDFPDTFPNLLGEGQNDELRKSGIFRKQGLFLSGAGSRTLRP